MKLAENIVIALLFLSPCYNAVHVAEPMKVIFDTDMCSCPAPPVSSIDRCVTNEFLSEWLCLPKVELRLHNLINID